MINVLVVCHGNINRSPACAAVLQDRLGIQAVVSSAGMRAKPGARAARRMRLALLPLGYDCEQHRARQISQEMVDEATHIIYMDGGNLRRLLDLYPSCESRAFCLARWFDPPATRVADPAYMRADSDLFRSTVTSIVEASERLASALRTGEI